MVPSPNTGFFPYHHGHVVQAVTPCPACWEKFTSTKRFLVKTYLDCVLPTPAAFTKDKTKLHTDLEKQRPPKKAANCFGFVTWKQEPSQLLQNTLLTLISQTGTDLFGLYERVHTHTCRCERELGSAGLQAPAVTPASIPSVCGNMLVMPRTSAGPIPWAANADKTWISREEQIRAHIHQRRQLNDLPFSRAASALIANHTQFVTINPTSHPINKI